MHTGTLNLHTLLVCEHKDKTNTDIHTASVVCESLLQEELVNVGTTVAVDLRLGASAVVIGALLQLWGS